MRSTHRGGGVCRLRVRAGLVLLLAAGLVPAALVAPGAPVAQAETSEEVRAQAEQENARLDELLVRLEEGRAEVADLSAQIDGLADQSIALQGTLIEDRAQLAQMVATSYRWGGAPSVWELALQSKSLEEFVANVYYADKVVAWQAACVEQVRSDKAALGEQMDQIEAARSERQAAVAALDETSTELSATVNALLERAAGLEAEERAAEEARLAEIARQAQLEEERRQAAAAQAAAEAEAQRQAEEAARAAQAEQERAAAEASAAVEGAAAEEASGGASADEPVDTSGAGEWITCIASAYIIADNTPPGSTATASGIPLDESVPTVAMPMSIDPARFYGQKIQIEYEGMTVIATVTDCGGMGGGSRGLDLTPAVFRAFGFSTADAWGLRTVRYRFL